MALVSTHRRHLRVSRKPCCEFCGSTVRLEQHHLFGQNHVPFVTLPLCKPHHEYVTRAIAGIAPNLSIYTSDLQERARRARMHALAYLWSLDEYVSETQK